jgi:hypothetical protein
MAWTRWSWSATSGSTAPAPGARESYRETDSDNAPYRGLSNGAQEVEISMAEVVSGNLRGHLSEAIGGRAGPSSISALPETTRTELEGARQTGGATAFPLDFP